MRLEKSCGAIVLKDDKVLLIQQYAGNWSFPKGHVEKDETEVETAIREIKEETNIDVEINENFRQIITYSPKKNVMKDVVFFLGIPKSDELKKQDSEIMNLGYYSIEEAFKMIIHEDVKNILHQLVEYLDSDKVLN